LRRESMWIGELEQGNGFDVGLMWACCVWKVQKVHDW